MKYDIVLIYTRIQSFKTIIVDSGFQRDITGFQQTISQQGNNLNLVLLKDVTLKTIEILDSIYQTDLPESLEIILPVPANSLFTATNHKEQFQSLMNDSSVDLPKYHSLLTQLLNTLNSQIQANINAVNNAEAFFKPYYQAGENKKKEEKNASLAITFMNDSFYRNFKSLSSSLLKWEKAFKIYSQLVKSDSPKEIELLSFHDGSLEILTNINIDIAIDLTEIIKYAFIAFGGFLSYKKTIKPVIESYLGNQKLIAQEKEREKEMLENIGSAVQRKLLEQHEQKLKLDTAINTEAIDKKVETVSKIITEHIINGNDIKLLVSNQEEAVDGLQKEVRTKAIEVKNAFSELEEDDIKLLISTYQIEENGGM